MKNKISNSALDCYNTCSKKYYYQYVEGYKADLTKTPLLFGSAIDAALNYILESIRDNKEWSKEEAVKLFRLNMNKWDGSNRLDYFKNEVPESIEGYASEEYAVFDNIMTRGLACLEVYINDVLPLIDTVLSVQNRFEVENEEGDTFVGVIDFIAKLKDGRTVLLDNKTASAKYPKNKVIKSQQLSFYIEQFPELEYAGYVVLIKNPEKEKGLTYQILVDKIPEETIAESFKLLDDTMRKIKNKEFSCNYKACKKYGKPCEYERLCSYGDITGLIKNEKK